MNLFQSLISLFLLTGLFGVSELTAGGALRGEQTFALPSSDSSVETRYEALLREEVKRAQTRVTQLLAGMVGRAISPADKLKVDNAMDAMQVKETLIQKFLGTPLMKSPTIRSQLMTLMKKDFITTADLSALKGLVAEERNIYPNNLKSGHLGNAKAPAIRLP